jgi:flagellar biosynthetic protein FliQ
MSEDVLLNLARQTLLLSMELAGPMLLFGLAVGLVVSMLQAVTQIQEATLSFVPKVLAVGLAFVIFLPWMIQKMVSFTTLLLGDFRAFIG